MQQANSSMRHTAEQQTLELQLTEAQRERDRWKGRYQPAYEAAAKLVAALEKRLQILKAKPDRDERNSWGTRII